ncbi:metallophosphoesterase [Prauserella cavernicola]|uniref:Metallophosphoesterase n=1 Tax=Prauserella cavernicola TaxID=2800127 RepID=A0A934V408_9PSEU|nr:metallophosphoesterase [Prauserella cavernicola]MBK1784917.1 metallophosphoesterase [Prauserella cavernicola]
MFILLVVSFLVLAHLYMWKRLVADTTARGSTARRTGTAALVVLMLLTVAALALGTGVDPAIAQWFAWPGYLWLAAFFYLAITLLVLELPRLFLRRWAAKEPADDEPSGVSRRTVLARGSAAVAGVVATGFVGYGVSVAMGSPTVTRVPMALRRLDPRAEGCRIALISDVHLGPIIGRSHTERIVELINAERPDLVAIAGDLVDGEVAHLAEAAAPLADLRSTHGTFFVTGNHEYYSGYQQWIDHLPSLGVRPLRNEHVDITHNGGTFHLAGVNDHTAYQWQDEGDVAAAVRGRDPGNAVVLLAHQPRDLPSAVDANVDLVLAGHTHGGQLSPFELIVNLQQGAVAGSYEFGDTRMYVTRGAGFWGPPVRVGAPPDITIVELRTT